MEIAKDYLTRMYSKLVNSPKFIAFANFLNKHATKTDLVMGSCFVGGLFFKTHFLGCSYLIPKVCATYFIGKVGLCVFQKTYPSYYEDFVHERSVFVSKFWRWIVPEDYMNCYKVISSLFFPYVSQFHNISPFGLLGGIYKAGTTQKPIDLPKHKVYSNQLELFSLASKYSEMATAMYGSAMIYGLMGEADSADDVKHLLSGTKDKEGYRQAFCDHCHITDDDILYVNWGCETEEPMNSTEIVTNNGMKITHPPFFLIHHEDTKSIVLCMRGTWNIKDFITDFKCSAIPWGNGKAHEGIALIAYSLLEDDKLNSCIRKALDKYPDYKLVTVGHSLGAGIASLLTIIWRHEKLYNNPICFAIAPPPVLSSSVSDMGVGYVYSFVNEDDVVPRLSLNGINDAVQLIVKNCHKRGNWLHLSNSISENNDSSIPFSSSELVNMYLPGSVFYLHPYLDDYQEYENRKRLIDGSEESSAIKRLQKLISKIPHSPGYVYFKSGKLFPNNIVITPMELIHHFAFNYEETIKSIYERIVNATTEVKVDMSN